MIILYVAKNSVHAFSYNFAKSEPIFMKLWAIVGGGPGRFWAWSAQ